MKPRQPTSAGRLRASVHHAEVLDDLDYQPPGHCVLSESDLPEHDDVDHGDGLPTCFYWRGFRTKRDA